MIEQTMDINTADGQMETFLCHPERGGPYPAVCFLMDAHGIREELRDMARRLACITASPFRSVGAMTSRRQSAIGSGPGPLSA